MNSTDTQKTYRTDVALSVASGRMLCHGHFDEMFKLITHLAGWPVMTHHLADRELFEAVSAKVIAQTPWMPGAIENLPDYTPDTAEDVLSAFVARCEDAHGGTVTLRAGEPLPPLHPLAGLEHLGGAR